MDRCIDPTCNTRWCFRTAWTIARDSCTDLLNGFSQYTSLPALAVAMVSGACQ